MKIRKNYFNYVIIFVIVLIFNFNSVFANIITTDISDIQFNLENYLTSLEENRNFHGSVLVSIGDEIILQEGYGMSDYENKIDMNNDSKLPIASITKQFVAVSIMQLVEDGKIKLSDKMSQYIPNYPRADEVTLEHLLTHTSGIDSYYQGDYELTKEVSKLSPMERTPWKIIDIHRNYPFYAEPGTTFKYSNFGYLVLGYIIEQVSGLELKDYLYENIFNPLNMDNTGVCFTDEQKNYDGFGYLGYLSNYYYEDEYNKLITETLLGAGYLYSTVVDLNIWSEALDDSILLSKESISEIFKPHVETNLPNLKYYGYGFFISENEDYTKYSHDGRLVAHSCDIAKFVEDDITIIYLTNKSGATQDNSNIENNLLSILKGENVELAKPREIIELSDEEINVYNGEYYLENEFKFLEVTVQNGIINAKYSPGVVATSLVEDSLYPESTTSFFSIDYPIDMNFYQIDNDIWLNFNLFGHNYELKKQ